MGKKSTPAPPDYTALANATAAGNKSNLDQQTLANRINQFTPWGSLVYDRQVTKNPITGEDEVTWNQYEDVSPEIQGALQDQFDIMNRQTGTAKGLLDRVSQSYQNPIDLSNMPEIQNLDPSKLGDWGKLDLSGLGAMPDSGFGAVEQVRDAMMSRLNPDLQDARSAEIQRLKAQGITEGSLAFDKAMERRDRAQTDAEMQALLGGAQEYGNIFNRGLAARQQGVSERGMEAEFANALRGKQFNEQIAGLGASGDARTRAIQEAAYLRNMPLNELNALMQGNQVQNPNFQGFNTAGYVPGADLSGAGQQTYQAQLAAANAKNAGTAGLTRGLFGLAGSAMGGPLGGMLGNALGGYFGGGGGVRT
jgi:hypothetical protein